MWRAGRFTPRKETMSPLYRRLVGPQGRSGQTLKVSSPTGIQSPDRPARSESLYSDTTLCRSTTNEQSELTPRERPVMKCIYRLLVSLYLHKTWQRLFSWSWALREKLTGPQLVKEFPAFYGTPRSPTAFTSARRLSVSSATAIQSMPPHSTSWCSVFNIILPSTPRSSKWSLSLSLPTKPLYAPLLPSPRVTQPAHPILFDLIVRIVFGEEYIS